MEATVFRDPEVLRRLSDFILLRVDVDRSAIPRAHRVNAFPAYSLFDAAERERFRLTGAKAPTLFSDAVEQMRLSAPAFVRAADLLDASQETEAAFLVGNTYGELGLTNDARTAYQQARKLAQQRGDKATAQLAEALSAFTFARDGDPSRALTLLRKLADKPVNRDTEALIWLTIGNAQRAALDTQSALDAYEQVLSLASPGSTSYKEASAAKAAASAAQDDPVKIELRRMQGNWVQISVEADGKKLEGGKNKPTLTIRGRKWIEGAARESDSSFTINPTNEPKQIDQTLRVGGDATVVLPGIYTLEDDTLKLCMPFPFGGDFNVIRQRPTGFTTKPGDPFVIIVYRRVKS
jgi:uncharacterized protein (TIGR03067 family)